MNARCSLLFNSPRGSRGRSLLCLPPLSSTRRPRNFKSTIRKFLEDFEDVMLVELLKRLPLRREVDHAIDLEPGAKPHTFTPCRMAPSELDELRRQLKELLDDGYIHPFKSP